MYDLENLLHNIETNLKQKSGAPINNFYNNDYNQYRNNIIFQNEANNRIKNEMYPYNNYNNNVNEIQIEMKKLDNEIENLKNEGYTFNKFREEIEEIDNKLLKIDIDILNIEKNIKNNENLHENAQNQEELNNQKVINKYNEIIEKYGELLNNLNIIKEDQNKAGIELMTSLINNKNYEEEISKVEDRLNQFLYEQNNKFNNTLSQIYNNNIENIEKKETEIESIESDLNNKQEIINNININLTPKLEIPLIKKNISDFYEKIKEIKIKYEQILKEHEEMNIKNNELHQNISNTNNDINDLNNQIEQNQINIGNIKNEYILKSDLKDINDKIVEINNKMDVLKENFEKNINFLNKANNELKDIKKSEEEIILKEEFEKETVKKQTEFDELKNTCYNQISELNNNYSSTLNQFNQYNEEEINSIININKQFKEISDKVNVNNNEIKKIGVENNNIYNNFLEIKSKFKLIDKNIFNLKGLENNNSKIKEEIKIISDKIIKLEKDLLSNKDNKQVMEDMQLENLEKLDNFNKNLNNENELRENKYQEMIKEAEKNEKTIENHINEINQKQEDNVAEIFNKLKEFRNQQALINEKNKKELEQLNKGISKQIEEFENIKRSLMNETGNNKILLEKRIDKLEKEISDWVELSKKLEELMELDMEENNKKLQEMNNQINTLKQNVGEKLKETKIYIDTILETFSKN